MSDIRAKVAYLQGLAEGLEIDGSSAEGRVLHSVIDVLEEIADHVVEVTEAQEELAEYVEDVDYDLGALEEEVFTDEEPEVLFIPDRGMEQAEHDEEVEVVCCPDCGEALAAGYGEIEIEADEDACCPRCGCALAVEDTEH